MNTSQQLRQVQRMMPQTIQSRQLLSLPLLSLKTFLNKLVLDNPLIEIRYDSEPVIACGDITAVQDRDPPDDGGPPETFYKAGGGEAAFDERFCGREAMSLHEFLRFQLHVSNLTARQKRIGECIIDNIDGNGYLRESVAYIAAAAGCGQAEARRALALVQGFHPKGVAAATLSECLRLQADPTFIDYPMLMRILEQDLALLAGRRYAELHRQYGVGRARAQAMLDYLRTLNPRPGSEYPGQNLTPFIAADASVACGNGCFDVLVMGSADSLILYNRDYCKTVPGEEAEEFLRIKKAEAANLIRSINMRHRALVKLIEYIVARQESFFLHGPGHLVPLTMREAAAAIGMHLSTVSRCANNKYVETPFGVFPLKHFFSAQIGNTGTSNEHALAMIAQLIRAENKEQPKSDRRIADELAASGICVSRRAVACYRERLNIGCQRERRRYI